MARSRFGACGAAAIISLSLLLPACGGKKAPSAVSGIPARINLNPSVSYSIQAGTTLQLTATAVNAANANVNVVLTYNSSNPGLLTISPSGLVCAGQWNAPAYTVCTAGTAGTANVTASALSVTSPPTLFFVHPPISSIQITEVPLVNSPPPACPNQGPLPAACNIPFNTSNCTINTQNVLVCGCLSQNQVVTLQATALDVNGNDMTSQVGTFTWIAANSTVPKITPIVTVTAYNVPTNQATVSPTTPGQTQIIASASGAFSQPYVFETCPVQCIDLAVGQIQSGVTNFVTNKGTSETIVASAVDVQGCIVPKPGLTWVSSEPAAISAPSSCNNTTSCPVTTAQQGAASITATCTPPACNIGFPLSLGTTPPYTPQPVYPVTAISGLVTGAASNTTILATSQDCYSQQLCDVGLYNVSSSTNLPGASVDLPSPPNSLMFDPAGDKAYVGSEFGAFTLNPSNIGTNTSPFAPLLAPGTPQGLVTGKILAISPNGSVAIFSDTIASPNQVYVVNTAPASTTALNLNAAIAAAFSPDGLRVYILADAGTTLYSYSPLQYLQPVAVPLSTPAAQIVFNGSGTFALLAGGVAPPDLSIYNTCNNSPVTLASANVTVFTSPPQFLTLVPGGNIPLGTLFGNTVIPSNLDPTGLDFFIGLDNVGNGASTGIDVIATNTSFFPPPAPYTSLCPLPVTLAQYTTTPPTQWPANPFHISIGQGTFNPIAFFVTASATQAYIVTTDVGVLIYNFNTNSVSKVPMINNASPVAASVTADGAFIYVAGSDGLLHQLNPSLLLDQNQTAFLPLPNSSNDFCFNETTCTLDMIAVKP
jgi:hypothetical protein